MLSHLCKKVYAGKLQGEENMNRVIVCLANHESRDIQNPHPI